MTGEEYKRLPLKEFDRAAYFKGYGLKQQCMDVVYELRRNPDSQQDHEERTPAMLSPPSESFLFSDRSSVCPSRR